MRERRWKQQIYNFQLSFSSADLTLMVDLETQIQTLIEKLQSNKTLKKV